MTVAEVLGLGLLIGWATRRTCQTRIEAEASGQCRMGLVAWPTRAPELVDLETGAPRWTVRCELGGEGHVVLLVRRRPPCGWLALLPFFPFSFPWLCVRRFCCCTSESSGICIPRDDSRVTVPQHCHQHRPCPHPLRLLCLFPLAMAESTDLEEQAWYWDQP